MEEEDPIEAIALKKLRDIFQEARGAKKPKERVLEITFLAGGKKYKGDFQFSFEPVDSKKDVLIMKNPCSTLEYTYGNAYPYSTRINANRRSEPCFRPRLEGPSADVLQILSTKIRLQVPDHREIAIFDEAKKDGVYISKAKLVRGLPSIYEKYGYESYMIDSIKIRIRDLKAYILDDYTLGILKQKTSMKDIEKQHIIDIMKTIPPENERIRIPLKNGSAPEFISNMVYDDIHWYLYWDDIETKGKSDLDENPSFELVFNENSAAWKGIKDNVKIVDVADITESNKVVFSQLPDPIRNSVIRINENVYDDEPVPKVINRVKEMDEPLSRRIYNYMDTYLRKRKQVEILMDLPLSRNKADEKYKVGDLSEGVKEQFYKTIAEEYAIVGKEPIAVDDSMYVSDVLRALKKSVPDYHFDKVYILLYETFIGPWMNQNGGGRRGGRRKTKKHAKHAKGRQGKKAKTCRK